MTPRPVGVPLSAAGLRLVVEPIVTGHLAPAITLRVYSAGMPTSVGATLPASEAEHLAALILAAGRCAEPGPGPDAG